jgi:choline oxidase
MTAPDRMTEVCDYLIIGGGSAGCVVARRLAERSSGRIILLEAGQSDENDPAAFDLKQLDQQSADYDWGFTASPLPGGLSKLKYARAKMLGGCANHNDCAFIRPPGSDFDYWEQLGAAGWSAVDMEPMWARVHERVTVQLSPLNPFSEAFVAAGEELGLTRRDFSREVKAGVGPFPLNAIGRLRQSSSITYLHPLSRLPKHLEIWTGVTAQRVVFDGRRAIGAETSRGVVHARHVILACGSIQTPQLLMVSGIGPATLLASHGIEVLHDNPHVGQHLKDHVAAPVVWSTRQPVGDWDICPFEATMMLQLDEAEAAPDILFHFGLRVREKYVEGARFPHIGDAVKASPNVTRARSEGEVLLSGPSIQHKPIINLNYFSDAHDLPKLLQAMKFTRQLIETESLSSFLKEELYPGPSVQTDADWEAYIRDVCETVYHPCGTARIGDVVDWHLRVKGVKGLYVVDASVFPSMITVNINAAVMMVAEKAATLIP